MTYLQVFYCALAARLAWFVGNWIKWEILFALRNNESFVERNAKTFPDTYHARNYWSKL